MNWSQLGMGDRNDAAVILTPWGTCEDLTTDNLVGDANFVIDCSRGIDSISVFLNEQSVAGVVRVAVTNFKRLTVGDQCRVAHLCRQFRESRRDGGTTQFVFEAGRWNWIKFENTWRQELSASPFLQQAHHRILEPLDRSGVWNALADARLVGLRSNPIDELCCNLVLEFTGGRWPLVKAVINQLTTRSGDIRNCLQSTLVEVTGLHDLVDSVCGEWNKLTQDAQQIVRNTIFCNFNRVCSRDINTADAILSGLVVKEPQLSGPNIIVLVPSCKCVQQVLLREKLLPSNDADNLGDIGDSCVTVMTQAYRKVLEIECLLRQVLAVYWTAQGLKVQDAMSKIKVSGSARSIPIKDLINENKRSGSAIAQDFLSKRQTVDEKVSLLGSATEWKKHQFENLDQPDVHLLAYITSGELESAIINDQVGLVSKNNSNPAKPFQHEKLMSIMQRFRPIRNAVAHFQPLCITAIATLDSIKDELVKTVSEKANSFVPQNGGEK